MQLVITHFCFGSTISQWLSENQNFIDCGGKSNATWLEVFDAVSKFWNAGQVYKVIDDKQTLIGFILIENTKCPQGRENDTFHSFVLPKFRNAHNAYNLLEKVYNLMFNDLKISKIKTLSKDDTTTRYLLRKGFKKEKFKRYDYNVFTFTKRKYFENTKYPGSGIKCRLSQ